MPIDDEIKKGLNAMEQFKKIKKELDEDLRSNPLSITESISAKMKEIEEQIKKVGKVTDDNIEKVKELTGEFESLAKTKSALEGLEKVIRGIGAALGIALPQLKALEIVMFIAKATFEWSENSAKVNKQLYDIGANLGYMGDKATEVYAITAKGTESLAWQFKVSNEEVRNTIGGLTQIGFGMGNIEESTGKVLALSKLWSEYTPQEQTKIMSRYMKEFGMEGEQAQNVMIGIVNLANELKGIMPKLDIKEFASQVQDVAVSMRKYGLEASDAIALTATLTKLGIDQARIPELAKGIGAMGMDDPAKTMYMMDTYYAKLYKDEKNYQEWKDLSESELSERGLTTKLEHLREEHETRSKFLKDYGEAGSNVAKKIGMAHTLEAGELAKAQFAVMDDMFSKLTQGGKLANASVEETIGLVRLNAPFIEGLGVAGSEALVKRLQELKTGKPLEQKEGETKEAFTKRVEEEKELKLTLEKGGTGAVVSELIKEWNEGTLISLSDQSLKKAEEVATATQTMKNDVGVIKGLLGDWFRSWGKGESPLIKRVLEEGKPVTYEKAVEMGMSQEKAKEFQIMLEKAKDSVSQGAGFRQAEISGMEYGGVTPEEKYKINIIKQLTQEAAEESSKKASVLTKEAAKTSKAYETYYEKAKEGGIDKEEQKTLNKLQEVSDKAWTDAAKAITELTEQFKDIPMTFKIDAGEIKVALDKIAPNGKF